MTPLRSSKRDSIDGFDALRKELMNRVADLRDKAEGEYEEAAMLWRRTRREVKRFSRRSDRPTEKIIDGAEQITKELRNSAKRLKNLI